MGSWEGQWAFLLVALSLYHIYMLVDACTVMLSLLPLLFLLWSVITTSHICDCVMLLYYSSLQLKMVLNISYVFV